MHHKKIITKTSLCNLNLRSPIFFVFFYAYITSFVKLIFHKKYKTNELLIFISINILTQYIDITSTNFILNIKNS